MSDVIDTTKVRVAGAYGPTGKLLASGADTAVENAEEVPSGIYRNNELDDILSVSPRTVTAKVKPKLWQKIKKSFKNLWL